MKQKVRSNILLFLDMVLVNFSLAMAYFLRLSGDYSRMSTEFRKDIVQLIIIGTIVKIVMFALFKLYSSLWRYASVYEMVSIVGAAFFGNAILTGYIVIANVRPWSIFIITFFIDIFLIGGLRFGYRAFRRFLKGQLIRFGDSKRVLIIGGGDAGAIVVKELKHHSELNSVPVAIIDDDISKKGKKINGVNIVGGRNEIINTVNNKRIDEIIIAMPAASKKVLNDIYNECSKTHCKIKILPSMSQLIDESVAIKKIRDVNIEDLLGREQIKLESNEIASYLENQVVLVTGGGGSIGSELCRQIATYKPKKMIILDNYENNLYEIQNELLFSNPELNMEAIMANIREKHRMESIFNLYKPDVVFHAAAHKHVPLMETNPTEAIRNNVFGTMNVAECADKAGVRRFVLISTDKAVNPTNIMGATKRIAEMIIQAVNKHSKTEFVAVRFGNVLGSNGSVIPLFKKQIEQGGPVSVTHPDVIRYFMTIPEAVQLVMQAGAMAKGGEIFVLDMGQPVKIYDLARNLIKLSGFEPDEDIEIKFIGLRPGEKLYEELLMAEEGLESTMNDKIFVAQPVFTDLGLLKREIDYLKEIIINDDEKVIDYIKTIVPTYQKAN